MKSLQALARRLGNPNPADIDQLYGLEPVYEPGDDPRLVPLETDTDLQCPWCGEHYQSAVDVSAGDQQLTEDCQICCRPIELHILIDRRTGVVRVQARRADG